MSLRNVRWQLKCLTCHGALRAGIMHFAVDISGIVHFAVDISGIVHFAVDISGIVHFAVDISGIVHFAVDISGIVHFAVDISRRTEYNKIVNFSGTSLPNGKTRRTTSLERISAG
jgi:hypothetical protein